MSTAAASQRHQDHWLGRALWGSLHEPRFVTSVMVVIYIGFIWDGLQIIAAPPDMPPQVGVAVAFVIGGSALAAPSAWRGAWRYEQAGVVMVMFGQLAVMVDELAHIMDGSTSVRYPAHLSDLTFIVALLLMTRLYRIWGKRYAPGRAPSTPLSRVQARAEVAKGVDAEVRASQTTPSTREGGANGE